MPTDLESKFIHETLLQTPKEFIDQSEQYQELMMTYFGAMREVQTKLEILNDEFQVVKRRNPIEMIKVRLKKTDSILEKIIKNWFRKNA